MSIWLLRIVWTSLPFSAGPTASAALDEWSRAPRTLAAVLLWAAWALVLVATLTPRPVGLTGVRIVAPGFLGAAVLVAATDSAADGTGALIAIAATLAATGLAASAAISSAAANGVAYGAEHRFPLRVPPALLLGPLPIAPLLVGGGVTAGPLLLADERWVAGGVALVAGLPTAALLGRAVHGLSRRWAVLVPAGLVLVDPLTLPDPVLFVRERIVSLRRAPRGPAVEAGTLDLRMGARAGSIALSLDRPTEFLATRRGVRGSKAATSTKLRFATVRSDELLALAAEHRIRVA